MAVKILGDTTMDLSLEMQKELGITCVPFSIEFGEESKHDTTFTNEEMFEYNNTHKEICHSSAVNVGELMEFFKEQSKDGSDLLYISISSKLSCGYQNAVIAKEDNPHIYAYDTESFSLGIALIALKAKELADNGKSIPEIIPIIDEYKKNTCATLMVDDLSFFARGGRISKVAALGANILKIKPILSISNGTMSILKKLIGSSTKKLAKKYVQTVLANYSDIDYSLALVGHTSEKDEGVDEIVSELKAAGFEKVIVSKTNSTNAVHGGPNVYGIAFTTSTEPKKKLLDLYMIENMLNSSASQSTIKKQANKNQK